MSVAALAHRIGQQVNVKLSEVNCPLTYSQIRVLSAIHHAQSDVSQTDVCTTTGIDRSTVATITAKLEARKLVKRVRRRTDARTYTITMTASGKELLAVALTAMNAVDQELAAEYPGVAKDAARKPLVKKPMAPAAMRA